MSSRWSIIQLRFSIMLVPGMCGRPPTTTRAGSPAAWQSMHWNMRGPACADEKSPRLWRKKDAIVLKTIAKIERTHSKTSPSLFVS